MPATTLAELETQRLGWSLRVFVPLAAEYASDEAWHTALSTPAPPALRLDRTAPYRLHGGLLDTTVGIWRIEAAPPPPGAPACALCGAPLVPVQREGLCAAGLAFHLACLPARLPALTPALLAALLAVAEERPLRRPPPSLYNRARYDLGWRSGSETI